MRYWRTSMPPSFSMMMPRMVFGREEEAMVRVAAGRWRARVRGPGRRCLVKWVRRRDATMVMWEIEGRKLDYWDGKVASCEE